MNDPLLRQPLLLVCVIVVASFVAAWLSGWRAAIGVVVGGLWNLASLWCLAHLLGAWLGSQPSRRNVIGWLVIKFPILYFLAWTLLKAPFISVIGFGVGFTVVLITATTIYAHNGRRFVLERSHGH